MAMKVKELEIEKTGMVLKLLGDKTRLSMVKMLENNECCVCEFVEIFESANPPSASISANCGMWGS